MVLIVSVGDLLMLVPFPDRVTKAGYRHRKRHERQHGLLDTAQC